MNRCLSLALAVLAAVLLVVAPSSAEMPKKEWKQGKKMLLKADTLYLRVDAPCETGRHSWGTWRSALVQVSPEGVETDDDDSRSSSWWHSESTFWGVRVNDPVRVDEVERDEGILEVYLIGQGPVEDEETVIQFVDVDSLDEFQQAFDHAFSRVPLQEEHDDWSQEMKEAIGDRRLVEGMTKRQAYYVTGRPVAVDKETEDGGEIEVWELRTDKGAETGYWVTRDDESTGLPDEIRFEDGVLVAIGPARDGGDDEFSLD